MVKIWSFVFVFFWAISVSAQVKVKAVVKDKDLGRTIENVNLQINYLGILRTTNEQGRVELLLPKKILSLSLSHIAYKDTSLKIDLRMVENDSLSFTFFMEYAPVELDVAEVSDRRLPDTIYGHEEHHIADFAFIDKDLLLLTYQKEDRWKRQNLSDQTLYKGTKLLLIRDKKQKTSARIKVPDALGFYNDYLNEVFLKTLEGVFHVRVEENDIRLFKISDKEFIRHVVPAIDTLNHHLLFSTWTDNFPAFDYYRFGLSDSVERDLLHVEDEEQLKMLRSEYKYLSTRNKLNAYRLELKTGIDKELIAAQMTGFAKSKYFEPIYAPCFILGDSIVVFNHPDMQIVNFDREGRQTNVAKPTYLLDSDSKYWQNQLIHDKETGKIYAVYKRHGFCYLKSIDLYSGETEQSLRLNYRYPEQIRVRDDKVYYVYRPYGSRQKRFLYSEEL